MTPRVHVLAVLAVLTAGLTLASAGFSGVFRVERQGADLSVRSDNAAAYEWTLRGADGRICDTGRVSNRRKAAIRKVAWNEELKLELRQGNLSEIHSVPPISRISPLSKPSGSAVIYQLPVRTWLANGTGSDATGTLNGLTDQVIRSLLDLNIDYVWLTGIPEFASLNNVDPDIVKGNAGSYYAVHDAWDVSPQVGTIDSLKRAIDRFHAHGIRVLLDLVPNHTARIHRSDVRCKGKLDFGREDDTDIFFSPSNNYFYIQDTIFRPPLQGNKPGADGIFDRDLFASGVQYEKPARVTGNDITDPSPGINDWFETAKLNYGYNFRNESQVYEPRPRTWDTILDVAVHWARLGVDGFRIDFAHAVPLAFWSFFAEELRKVSPEAFLMAEAYESDDRMKVPGFSYRALVGSGIDTVYNSNLYWSMRSWASSPYSNRFVGDQPGSPSEFAPRGQLFVTNFLENHDEIRLASRHFSSFLPTVEERGRLGYNYSVYSALQPGNFLIHGGQELREEADVHGPFKGDDGRTSIFDFVYQKQVRQWRRGSVAESIGSLRAKYSALTALKGLAPFTLRNPYASPTHYNLDAVSDQNPNREWIHSYVRTDGEKSYLVVLNSDPVYAREAAIHFTNESGRDTIGVLGRMGVLESNQWVTFREVLNRPGFEPRDPEFDRAGAPGWALYRAGGVPSGIYLGEMPPGQSLVFEMIVD